ncbi:Protein CBG05328 [Caenorhabditis briggsae]|uniref:JmjC domain-containing protein n=2 Tax=Caenorhabditis briggsae TaxID=6238 RepID=A0AAE8ZT41_CAEBR|nr:Protein CBG05328 [Caenorhabditis briggsae]ULT84289.1 hypothetical protein L3Y34_013160 [Caenorhabditis briggsae]CAP25825.1 Protein CBG05328 [Caenorhabditis briggsae]
MERSEGSSSPGKDEENAVAQEKIAEVVQGAKNHVRSAKRKKSARSSSASNGAKKQKRAVKKNKTDPIQAQPDCSGGIQKTAEEIKEFSSDWLARKVLVSSHIEMRSKGIAASSEAIEKMKEIARSVKESHCHDCHVELSDDMPDRKNYRWMEEKLHSQVLAEPVAGPTTPQDSEDRIPFNIHYTGKPFFDPKTVKGQDIVDAAKTGNKGFEDFDEQRNKFLYEEDTGIVEEEKCFFAGRGFKPEESKGYVPIPKFQLKDDSEESWNKLQEKVLGTSMCLIKGIKVNEETFSLETLAKVAPKYKLRILRQLPQPTLCNFVQKPIARGSRAGSRRWFTEQAEQFTTVKKYSEYFNGMRAAGEKAVRKIYENPETADEVLKKLEGDLKKVAGSVGIKLKKSYTHLVAFGTNFDVEERLADTKTFRFASQMAEINKFKAFLSPHGNLLGFTKVSLRGLNKPQIYWKVPGCRTCAHLENNGLGSINYNIGPGTCIWYGIPLEWAGKFQKLLKKRLGEDLGKALHSNDYWPSEEEIIEEGIPLQKFCQKPGDLAYVGNGTYHWVQSNDFTTNISWNIGQPTFVQLATAAVVNDNYLANQTYSIMPLETICWNMIIEGFEMDQRMKELVKRMAMRSLSKTQSQLDFFVKKNIKIFAPSQLNKGIYGTERCRLCADNLFNYIPLISTYTSKDPRTGEPINTLQPYCIKCVESCQEWKGCKVYSRHTMEDLVKYLDSMEL